MGTESVSKESILQKEYLMDMDALIFEKMGVSKLGEIPYKCIGKTRDDLAVLMGEIGFKVGAEIGVLAGYYSRKLCESIPDLYIRCVDPWLGFRRNSQNRMDFYYERFCRRVKPYHADVLKKTSMEALNDVPDGSLDFVYIDAMHEFDSVMFDIICWNGKVKHGGMIAGHDYSPASWCNGVMRAVDTFTEVHGIKQWYITCEESNDHLAPSYFWVKP